MSLSPPSSIRKGKKKSLLLQWGERLEKPLIQRNRMLGRKVAHEPVIALQGPRAALDKRRKQQTLLALSGWRLEV